MNRSFKATLAIVAALGLATQMAPTFAESDAKAAKAFAKKNDCFKCHAIDKTKKGPSYQKIAAMFKEKNKTDAQIFEHLTSSPKVKLEDGTEEEHKGLNPKDKDSISNLIMWLREQ
jgi:cytochrome c